MENYFQTLGTPVQILSDFEDYYDSHFQDDADMKYFTRMGAGKAPRPARLELLRSWGLSVVPSGTALELFESLPRAIFDPDENGDMAVDFLEFIVYMREVNFVGDGPVKMDAIIAAERFPDSYATLHIPSREMSDEGERSVSYRYIRVGKKEFWLKYAGLDAWRSNMGQKTCSVSAKGLDVPLSMSYIDPFPMCVIDFVMSEDGNPYAIDYSPFTRLADTPLVDFLPAEEAAFQIKSWILMSQKLTQILEELNMSAEDLDLLV